MARKCAICGKGLSHGHLVSHSNIKTNRTWMPNLHRIRTVSQGRVQRLNVCTRCLRSGKVPRAL